MSREEKRAEILLFHTDRGRKPLYIPLMTIQNSRPQSMDKIRAGKKRAELSEESRKPRRILSEMTGQLLRKRLRVAGISVREAQKRLGLECPQSIYRWFHGQALPSVDNLYILHRMLGCHMESLLVTEDRPMQRRCAAYYLALV